MKNHRATGTTTATATTPVGRVCPFASRPSRRPSSALTGPRPAPRESAEGVGPVAGSVGYHRFARAHDGPRPGARAPRSRSPLTPRGRRVTRPPGVSTTIPRRPLLGGDWLGERSRVRRGQLRRAARVVVDAAPAHVGPPRDVARYASLSFLPLTRTRERESTVNSIFHTIVSVCVSFAVAVAAARVRAAGRAGPPRNVNDPSAGSPTETLLRLLLPLNDQVWSSSRQHRQCRRIAAHQSEDLTKSFNR